MLYVSKDMKELITNKYVLLSGQDGFTFITKDELSKIPEGERASYCKANLNKVATEFTIVNGSGHVLKVETVKYNPSALVSKKMNLSMQNNKIELSPEEFKQVQLKMNNVTHECKYISLLRAFWTSRKSHNDLTAIWMSENEYESIKRTSLKNSVSPLELISESEIWNECTIRVD